MTEEMIFNMIGNYAFPIVICLYLLYERTKFNQEMMKTMEEISTIIKERLPKVN